MENMENKKKKTGRPKGIHTPIKYLTEKERKRAIAQSKTKYMLNKEWICDACNHDYKLAGKTKHLKRKKHKDNVKKNIMKKIIDITHNK